MTSVPHLPRINLRGHLAEKLRSQELQSGRLIRILPQWNQSIQMVYRPWTRPPSTMTAVPVRYEVWAEHRNATIFPKSSG